MFIDLFMNLELSVDLQEKYHLRFGKLPLTDLLTNIAYIFVHFHSSLPAAYLVICVKVFPMHHCTRSFLTWVRTLLLKMSMKECIII